MTEENETKKMKNIVSYFSLFSYRASAYRTAMQSDRWTSA